MSPLATLANVPSATNFATSNSFSITYAPLRLPGRVAVESELTPVVDLAVKSYVAMFYLPYAALYLAVTMPSGLSIFLPYICIPLTMSAKDSGSR